MILPATSTSYLHTESEHQAFKAHLTLSHRGDHDLLRCDFVRAAARRIISSRSDGDSSGISGDEALRARMSSHSPLRLHFLFQAASQPLTTRPQHPADPDCPSFEPGRHLADADAGPAPSCHVAKIRTRYHTPRIRCLGLAPSCACQGRCDPPDPRLWLVASASQREQNYSMPAARRSWLKRGASGHARRFMNPAPSHPDISLCLVFRRHGAQLALHHIPSRLLPPRFPSLVSPVQLFKQSRRPD